MTVVTLLVLLVLSIVTSRALASLSPKDAIKTTERWGTYQFCKAHGLPMRSFKDAMVAVPN